jgi:hypothetical protein
MAQVSYRVLVNVQEYWDCSIEVPDGVIAKGEREIEQYIKENEVDASWDCLRESFMNESVEFDDIEVIEE